MWERFFLSQILLMVEENFLSPLRARSKHVNFLHKLEETVKEGTHEIYCKPHNLEGFTFLQF